MQFGDYPNEIGSIVKNKCAVSGCHNTASYKAAGNFNLESWSAMFGGSSSGSPLIPFNSKFSSLCYFVNTYPDLGTQNLPIMPLNGTPLSHDEVSIIKNWIDNGAPDNKGNIRWADDPKRKKLYAVNQGCDVVTVLDSETQLPIRYIHVGNLASGNTPHHLKISPDGAYWYVVFIKSNIMQKFRCSDDTYIGDIPLTKVADGSSTDPLDDAQNWNTFVITKNGKIAYCVSWPDGKIAAVDLENRKLIHSLGGQGVPHGIVLNATEDKIYLASQTGNFITQLDTSFTNPKEIILETGPKNAMSSLDPHDMILAPNQQDILITCQTSNEIRVFNIPTNSVTLVLKAGEYPQEIVYSKGTHEFFVTCTNDTKMFPNSNGVIMRIKDGGYGIDAVACGFQPHGLAVDENKKLLYVLSRNISANGPLPHHTSQCSGRNGFVSFIDLNTFKVLPKRYELSVDPYFIYSRP